MATWSPVGGGPAVLCCEGEADQSGSWEAFGGRPEPEPGPTSGLMAKNTGLPFSRGNCCDLT